jgi:hypothetical protein
MTEPTRRELDTVPAMDLEKRAEQLAAAEFTANNGDPALTGIEAIGLWAQLDGSTKDNFRANARRQLAEEAKRRGDHDEMKRLHDLGQAVTGAVSTDGGAFRPTLAEAQQNVLQPPAAQVAMLAALEMGSSINALLKLVDSVCPSGGEYGLNGALATMSEVELTQTEEYLRQAADRVKRAMVG